VAACWEIDSALAAAGCSPCAAAASAAAAAVDPWLPKAVAGEWGGPAQCMAWLLPIEVRSSKQQQQRSSSSHQALHNDTLDSES